jgi:predicted  nucleic acid-binding Zn-ribbon protein
LKCKAIGKNGKGDKNVEVKIEHRLTEVEERAKSNSHRLDEVEKRQDNLEKLTSTVEVLAVREKNVENDVKEIKSDVKSLTSKPAKRWDSLVNQLITIAVAAIAGFILAKFGL